MIDWDKLRVFHAVAAAGSFTGAGRELKLSQSSVSRQIAGLEEQLGVALFHRHSRGLVLTEQGEALSQTAHDVFSKLALAEAAISEGRDTPSGQLVVTATVTFASIWLAPRLKAFRDQYPEIDLTLLASDGALDLSMREADIAVRIGQLSQPDLIQRHLMKFHHHVYASPEYLEQHGPLETVEDLLDHQLIIYNKGPLADLINPMWVPELAGARNRSPKPALEVNNVFCMVQAVESGLGVAGLPDYSVHDHARVVRVLPDVEGPTIDTYFVYPEELRHSKRIAVFRDFLLQQLADWRY